MRTTESIVRPKVDTQPSEKLVDIDVRMSHGEEVDEEEIKELVVDQ